MIGVRHGSEKQKWGRPKLTDDSFFFFFSPTSQDRSQKGKADHEVAGILSFLNPADSIGLNYKSMFV